MVFILQTHRLNPDATLLPRVAYRDYLNHELRILDGAAVNLAKDAGVTIRVFDLFEKGNLEKILGGDDIGSLVCCEK